MEASVRRELTSEIRYSSLKSSPLTSVENKDVPQGADRLVLRGASPTHPVTNINSENVQVPAGVMHEQAVGLALSLSEEGATLVGPIRSDVSVTLASSTSSTIGAVSSPSGQVRDILHQLSEAVRVTSSGSVEVQLNPKELGAVNIRVVSNDGGVLVMFSAERFETSELMRRHIDLLVQEFKSVGFGSDLSLSFSEKGAGKSGSYANQSATSFPPEDDAEQSISQSASANADGLNIIL